MTTIISAGASSSVNSKLWNDLPWSRINKQVVQLQMRIAKAVREGRKGKVKALQRILTCSFYAKCLAVKRVTLNKGGKTAGVDGIVWRTDLQKIRAIPLLKRHGYKPLPARRIYVPKKEKGKFRPISIPTMNDKAMQALWHMALSPIAEEWADPNSYGFRAKRSALDAIEQCFNVLAKRSSAQWVFEGDIYSCFDKISHQWLLENIPMDKQILRKFLKAGYMEDQRLYTTEFGTGQGSVTSPTIALMALSGIEQKLKRSIERKDKVHYVSYADDFVITGKSPEVLKEKVMPIVIDALKEVGLELSNQKSKITNISQGFDFLGYNVRKYKEKLLIKPAKANIKTFLAEIRAAVKSNYGAKTENLISLLNPKILGWTSYFRSSVAKKVFSYIDAQIYKVLNQWTLRRHPNKRKSWIARKYFTRKDLSNWRFHAMIKDKKGNKIPLYLKRASETPIRRHIKIRSNAHPYNPEFKDYFKNRDNMNKIRKVSGTGFKLREELLGNDVALLSA